MHEGKCQETDTTSLARVKDIKTQPRVNHLPERNRINLITEIRQVLCNLYYSAPDAVEEVPAHDGVGGGVALRALGLVEVLHFEHATGGAGGVADFVAPLAGVAASHRLAVHVQQNRFQTLHGVVNLAQLPCNTRKKKKRGEKLQIDNKNPEIYV